MMRFIYACMALLLVSFVGIPIYNGISKERAIITAEADIQGDAADDELSFEQIYALADEGQSDNPAFLNEITPAAGGQESDGFSSGFVPREDPALAETPAEPEPVETQSDS